MRAMVLCAGFGTRLGDLTHDTPKPMLRLQGRPLLEYILRHLARHGFNQIAINLHFMPETIKEYFGDGANLNIQLTYSYEPELLGTAGGVKKIEHFLRKDDLFLIQYGDILTDQNLTEMVDFHKAQHASVTLLVHQRARSNSIVSMDEERRIVGFLERPSEEEREGVSSSWVNSGICIGAPELLDAIPANVTCDLPRNIFPKFVGSGRLYGFPLSSYRCAIDSPERLADARASIADGRCGVQL